MLGKWNVALLLDESSGLKPVVEILLNFVETLQDLLRLVDAAVCELSLHLLAARLLTVLLVVTHIAFALLIVAEVLLLIVVLLLFRFRVFDGLYFLSHFAN